VRTAGSVEDLLRPLVPQVLGVLVRRYGRFDQSAPSAQDTDREPGRPRDSYLLAARRTTSVPERRRIGPLVCAFDAARSRADDLDEGVLKVPGG
jgi:hypothetical protein